MKMKWMNYAVGSVLALSQYAHAGELLCRGTVWYNRESAEATKVLFFDPQAATLTTDSANGKVSGNLKNDPAMLTGYLSTASGFRYFVNLDRYTGNFVMMVEGTKEQPVRVEFQGICKKADRLF